MEMEVLQKIQADFENIQQMREPGRTIALSRLMTVIENKYDIPLMEKDTTEDIRNSEYYILYMQIEKAREL